MGQERETEKMSEWEKLDNFAKWQSSKMSCVGKKYLEKIGTIVIELMEKQLDREEWEVGAGWKFILLKSWCEC
jgi:hypothetical protein